MTTNTARRFGAGLMIALAGAASTSNTSLTASHLDDVVPAPTLRGVWQAVEVRTTGPGARTIAPQPNLALFGATHYSRTQVAAEHPRPQIADIAHATADELRATWGPFVAEAGTYELSEGRLLTLKPMIAKNPAAVGSSIVYSFRFIGDELEVTSVSDRNGPVPYPETIRCVRIE